MNTLRTLTWFVAITLLVSCSRQQVAVARVKIVDAAPIAGTIAAISKSDSSILIDKVNDTLIYTVKVVSKNPTESIGKVRNTISKLEDACKSSNPPIEFEILDPPVIVEVSKAFP